MGGGLSFLGGRKGGEKGWKVWSWLKVGCCFSFFLDASIQYAWEGWGGGCVVETRRCDTFFIAGKKRFGGQSHWQFLDQGWSLKIHVFVDLIFLPCQEITMDIYIYISIP